MLAKDFASDQEVRWCPGCGNYVVLATVQRVLAELGVAKNNIAIISGIGCSSRFVYYLDTYGFHTIHGRATAVAAGLKMMRPELSVWVVTGDGDGLSIGLGHLLHLMRRNIDVNILMLNNQVYGLTKGQHSPTSALDSTSNSSPFPVTDQPFNPIKLALAAECSFVARTMDPDPKHLAETIKQAAMHQGTAFIEILQNCNVYNNDIFAKYRDLSYRREHCLYLQADQPIRFGAELERGVQLVNQQLVINNDVTRSAADQLLQHEVSQKNLSTMLLADCAPPDWPLVLGIFRAVTTPCYNAKLLAKKQQVTVQRTLQDVLQAG